MNYGKEEKKKDDKNPIPPPKAEGQGDDKDKDKKDDKAKTEAKTDDSKKEDKTDDKKVEGRHGELWCHDADRFTLIRLGIDPGTRLCVAAGSEMEVPPYLRPSYHGRD